MASTPPQAAPARDTCRLLGRCREVASKPEKPYPPMSSIPRMPEDRLRAPPTTPTSVLYLAYGSNLCAETFLGVRGIRPISRIPVSAPTLDLTFDLAGFPYLEPCFANSAPRKIPKIPKLPDPINPPKPPKVPPFELPTPASHYKDDDEDDDATGPQGAKWTKGLIGVVYEVTPDDYTTILATEGGGASYADILVPCLPLPPRMAVPEKPPIDLPKPFFAHTLFAPSVPGKLPPEVGQPDGPPPSDSPDRKKWYWRFLTPPHREPPGYAQPSPRYLTLIRDGARENELPDDYQAYLARLQPYTPTTCGQRLGRLLFLAPVLVVGFLAMRFAGGKGRKRQASLPAWAAAAVVVVFNLVWMTYDAVLKPLLGDGEHTQDGEGRRGWLRRECCADEEKRGLLVEGGV